MPGSHRIISCSEAEELKARGWSWAQAALYEPKYNTMAQFVFIQFTDNLKHFVRLIPPKKQVDT